MRTVVYNYIKALGLKSVSVSNDLPYSTNGNELYLKNKKTIYVDVAQSQQDPAIDALDGSGAVDETTTVSVYFVNDAKKLPSDYDTVINQLKLARTATGTEGFIQKTCNVSSSYQEDSIVTQLVFSFRKIITN
ncbi:hypothetical protein UFOVP645_22 [uncultured Caudovirales phage]|uniref:Uncharacterized protein n=1 Tax=uncultured Caudovirales phage TaxID=2100421 RepID=A0A6J5N6I8_9CAUD|nr:hypothetical protein UFOVP645_22 [uncultured Caudovirales phage]